MCEGCLETPCDGNCVHCSKCGELLTKYELGCPNFEHCIKCAPEKDRREVILRIFDIINEHTEDMDDEDRHLFVFQVIARLAADEAQMDIIVETDNELD